MKPNFIIAMGKSISPADMQNDSHEWYNVAQKADYPQHIQDLKNELIKWRFKCLDRKKPQSSSFVRDFMKPGYFRY